MGLRWRMLVAAGAMAATLTGCGEQAHRLQGAFILNDAAVRYDESGCSGTGQYADIRGGLAVVVRDEAGKAVGSAELVVDPTSSASQCVYRWETTVADAASYSVQVGQRAAGTYTAEDMNRRYWQVATTVGE